MKNSDNYISAPEVDYLYVTTSKLSNAGKGLYSAIQIYKDEIISVFKGEIITDEVAKIRVELNQDQYFINMLDGSIMDSMNVECFAKYANDAEGFASSKYKNNSKIALDEENNVCIIATKTIKSEDEIFCSYGKKYWKKHSWL
ncbi:SET domain-containing protein-lysine N-methyltransferase [Flavobacterium sp.]|uniref:SET domain-containing protein-lysine N-methyltransferase n=1 Tax=Flavobacterium sp. TaxID=239 RepID=UPI003D2E0D2D